MTTLERTRENSRHRRSTKCPHKIITPSIISQKLQLCRLFNGLMWEQYYDCREFEATARDEHVSRHLKIRTSFLGVINIIIVIHNSI